MLRTGDHKVLKFQTCMFGRSLIMDPKLNEAVEEFVGMIRELLKNLIGKNSELWGNELKKFLRKEPCWSNGQVAQVTQPKTN